MAEIFASSMRSRVSAISRPHWPYPMRATFTVCSADLAAASSAAAKPPRMLLSGTSELFFRKCRRLSTRGSDILSGAVMLLAGCGWWLHEDLACGLQGRKSKLNDSKKGFVLIGHDDERAHSFFQSARPNANRLRI